MSDLDGKISPFMDQAPSLILAYATKIVLALLVFFIGKILARSLTNLLEKGMTSKGVDPTVSVFTRNISYYALFAMVVIAALGQLGVQTASFVAIIGAAGLAVGFALQGSLSNFASGVLIIIFRPFKNGDYVEAGGAAGVIHEISIFSTIFKTPDNKTVIVANSAITGGNIVNYSLEATRRVDLTVGVGYGSDIKQVQNILQNIAQSDSRILEDKDITIAVGELADSSVNFVFRVWVKTEDYWAVFFDLNAAIKTVLDEQGIEIPFPQLDVFLKNQSTA